MTGAAGPVGGGRPGPRAGTRGGEKGRAGVNYLHGGRNADCGSSRQAPRRTAGHLLGADARDLARRARPDHRGHRAAHHRQRSRRPQSSVLGGHRLPAGHDGLDAAVGQARRPVRPQGPVPGRDRHLPDRLGAVRAGPHHDRADRVPGAAGPGRRRPDGAGPGDRGRRRARPRAGQVPGRLRGGLRRGQRGRAAAGRLLRRQRSAGAGFSTSTCRSGSSRSWSSRSRCPGGRVRESHKIDYLGTLLLAGAATAVVLGTSWGGTTYPWGSASDHRSRGARGPAGRGLVDLGRPGRRAGAAAAAVPQPGVPGERGGRLRGRFRDVRVARLPAAVPAGGAGRVADHLGGVPAAHGGRPAAHLGRPAAS